RGAPAEGLAPVLQLLEVVFELGDLVVVQVRAVRPRLQVGEDVAPVLGVGVPEHVSELRLRVASDHNRRSCWARVASSTIRTAHKRSSRGTPGPTPARVLNPV